MQLDPHDPLLNIEAAQMYHQRGMMAKELQMLNLAVGIDPEIPVSHYVLGLTYERQSEPSKAMTEFREAKRLINMLSSPDRPMEVSNRIILGPRNERYYHDRFGHEYLLDWIMTPLAKKLSK